MLCSGRGSLLDILTSFIDFNHLNIKVHPVSPGDKLPKKPETWEEMKAVAAKLSEGLPHVRLDLYEVNGKVYFGEYTFYHWGGCGSFEPEEWLNKLGDWIKLPNKKK